ncbi:metal dependent phosphohydrolase [Desulfovibrio sp. X2]|uniref:DVU_1551 family NTP transferase n=1 Tax=Desulfovibrio sp. X2 TaxID=941449 RepID=UPI0003589E6C|nr:NTP transferase domain-containing protein [Desulfovibrio sp. X2]EPR41248.1 metal dependent phosphohydrolase [Desulfovibrio sp. X2]
MSPRFHAVILAAGLSSRMGGFKPLLPLGGETLLSRAAGLFREAGVTEITAVAGHRADETLAEAGRLGLAGIVNPDFAEGMFTSARAGLAAVPDGVDAVFVLPVDIPLVRPATVRRLMERFAGADRTRALTPSFGSGAEPGHPPLIPAGLVPDILAWQGAGGLRGALEGLAAKSGRPPAEALELVPVADRNILFDLDHPDDYQEAIRRWQRRGVPTPEEAEALLDLQEVPAKGRAHARAVAEAALACARALEAAAARPDDAKEVAGDAALADLPPDSGLDHELILVSGLLHDIAKGQPRHERAGGRLLDDMGFFSAARIVGAHRDIAPEDAPRITERELVYFADKLVRCDRFVGVARRFQEKLDLFAGDAEATAAISRRRANALDMQRRIEAAAGRDVASILAEVMDVSEAGPCA